MKTSKPFWAGLCLSACLIAPVSKAAVIDIDLCGRIADGYFYTQEYLNAHFDVWQLNWTFGVFDPVTVAQGDELRISVNLDGVFHVPPGGFTTGLEMGLFGTTFDIASSANVGTTSAFLNGDLVWSNEAGSYTTGAGIIQGSFFPPEGFSFDRALFDFTITQLDHPVLADIATFRTLSTTLHTDPVPLPAGLWLLGSGVGLWAGVVRRRRTADRR
jgi:hypothetical protein